MLTTIINVLTTTGMAYLIIRSLLTTIGSMLTTNGSPLFKSRKPRYATARTTDNNGLATLETPERVEPSAAGPLDEEIQEAWSRFVIPDSPCPMRGSFRQNNY